MDDTDWKEKLTPEQYHILREKGTETPFTGKYLNHKEKGMYVCGACGNEVFSSETKFETHTGWPSFYDIAHNDAVKLEDDDRYGMHRKEVLCAKCGSHLGHVFDYSGIPTGKDYCINSCALDFKGAQA